MARVYNLSPRTIWMRIFFGIVFIIWGLVSTIFNDFNIHDITEISLISHTNTTKQILSPTYHTQSINDTHNQETIEITATNAPKASDLNTTQLPSITDIKHQISQIIELRIKKPSKCSHHNHILTDIHPIEHNWAPYYFRCKPIGHNWASRMKNPLFDEVFLTKDILYSHIFKAAGSTIMGGMKQLAIDSKLNDLNKYKDDFIIHGGVLRHKEYTLSKLLDFMNENALFFSFVRNPLHKFLSGFYEVHKRIVTGELSLSRFKRYDKLSGIQILRIWIERIFRTVYGNRKRRSFVDYINPHMKPNTEFLKFNVPFTFIGNLDNILEDLPQILEPYLNDEELKNDAELLMGSYFPNRNAVNETKEQANLLKKFRINESDLNKNDIKKICEIYWLDYLCFPFSIPKQCDIEDLINKHYGKHVEYETCY